MARRSEVFTIIQTPDGGLEAGVTPPGVSAGNTVPPGCGSSIASLRQSWPNLPESIAALLCGETDMPLKMMRWKRFGVLSRSVLCVRSIENFDLAVSDSQSPNRWGAVVCHPWSRLGGQMGDPVHPPETLMPHSYSQSPYP